MKKKIFTLVIALVATITTFAQQIAVVSNGSTDIYATLAEAIAGADPGSVVYLPGGGFTIADDVKITKKLTIIGIGHNAQSDNVDGRTLIAGNFFFDSNSDGSAVMGCYINGNVNIGTAETAVNRILVKYCNLNAVIANNVNCNETVINQNYIRSESSFSGSSATFTNNICKTIWDLDNGTISYNIVFGSHSISYEGSKAIRRCDNDVINGNVIMDTSDPHDGNNCQVSYNMSRTGWGNNFINVVDDSWANVFEYYSGLNPSSNFHFKDGYKSYESVCGIYGGTGFSDGALPPVPYIKLKNIPDKTDASGMLHISIAVKASE